MSTRTRRPGTSGTALAAQGALGDMIEAEREGVALLGEIATGSPAKWPGAVRRGFVRYGKTCVARAALDGAMLARDRNLNEAEAMAAIACDIADSLSAAGRRLADLQVEAWRERAVIAARRGRHADAARALDTGDKAAAASRDPLAAAGSLRYARAWVYALPDCGRYEEAQRLLSEGEDELHAAAKTGDAELLRVSILLRSHRFTEALAAIDRHATDCVMTQSLRKDRAFCCLHLGRTTEALAILRSLAEDDDAPIESGKVAWLLGDALIANHQPEEAIHFLQRASVDLERAGVTDAAIGSCLSLIRAQLAADPTADVRPLCLSVAERSSALDLAEPSRSRHVTAEALQFLRNLAERDAVTLDAADFVATFVAHAQTRPLTFRAPNTYAM